MKSSNYIKFLFLLLLLVNLISPTSALVERYVKLGGYDGSTGTGINDAYGSVTKAVQELIAANTAVINDDYVIYIERGTYSTSAFNISDLNNLTSIKIIGDKSGTIFTNAGEIVLNFVAGVASYGIHIVNQSVPLTFDSIEINNLNQPIMKIENSSNVKLLSCSLTGNARAHDGLILDTNSHYITVDSCQVTQATHGFVVDQNHHNLIQNCVIKDNDIGIKLVNSENSRLINNLITDNVSYGLYIDQPCVGSVIFNNILKDNNTQIFTNNVNTIISRQTDTDVITGDPIYSNFFTWRSTANVITPSTGKQFGKYNTTDIFNQKQWQEIVHRDYWNSSISYPIVFETSPTYQPQINQIILGHAIESLGSYQAPNNDINNPLSIRPLKKRDAGCIELTETTMFHRINLNPDASRKAPQTNITLSVNLKDNDDGNVPSYSTSLYKFYIFLHRDSNPTDTDDLAVVIGTNIIQIDTGIYQFDPNTLSLDDGYQFNIQRNLATNSGTRYYCRIIEWDNWNAGNSIAYGGRGNDTSTLLFWTNLPDPNQSIVTASSPILASDLHQDLASITVQVKDVNGDIIPNLWRSDLTFSASAPVDWHRTNELGSSPGTYQKSFHTSIAGPRTITVTVLGVTLNQQPIVDVHPGLHGNIRSTQGQQPIAGATITVLASDYRQLASTIADSSGDYKLLVPSADGSEVIIRLVDPAGQFPQKDVLLVIPSHTALEQNFEMEPIPAHKSLEAHAFPNPVKQGQMISIPYNLPQAGKFKLAIYDLRGREIMVLFDGPASAGQGQFNWPGFNQAGKKLAPGTYRLVMRLDKTIATQKIVIVP